MNDELLPQVYDYLLQRDQTSMWYITIKSHIWRVFLLTSILAKGHDRDSQQSGRFISIGVVNICKIGKLIVAHDIVSELWSTLRHHPLLDWVY